MQSYSSAVDGKTFVRVGGGQSAQTLSRPSNSTLHSVKSDLGFSSTTSSRRSNVTSSTASSPPSHVTIASPGIRRADTTNDVRQSNASVTVKSVAPVKKMTSLIDTKTGHVTSSVISQESGGRSNPSSVLVTSSSPTSITSPSSLLTYGPESPSVDSIRSWMTSSSPRATSVLMTSTGMQVDSVTSEGTATTLTGRRIPASRNSSSIILSSIPGTLPAEMTSSGHVMTTEVYPQQEARRSKGPLADSTSIKQSDSAGSSTGLSDESEIDFHSSGKESVVDREQVFSDVIAETRPSIIVEGKDAVFDDSAKVTDASGKTTSALAITPSVALLSMPPSGILKVPEDATPQTEPR